MPGKDRIKWHLRISSQLLKYCWLLLLACFCDDLLSQADADSVMSGWGAYPVVYYTDQTSLAFGAYGIHYFKNNYAKHISNLNSVAIYTLRKQIILELGAQLYLREYRLLGVVNYMKFPNTFYGIGNDTKTEDAEDFSDEGVLLDLNYQKEVLSDMYLGFLYNFQTHALIETDPNGQLATGILAGTDESFRLSGVGASLDFDTRDHVNFPGTGSFLRATWVYYTKSIGSDFNFIRYTIDLRHFFPLFQRGVMAFQGTWTQVTDQTPVLVYPVLGDDRLRGFSARYWDKNLLTLQMEYRKMIWGNFGLALFAGVGDVSDKIGNFQLRTMKFGFGFGLRYMVLPEAKINLRIDFGIGTYDNSSLTFMAGDAF